MIFTGQILINKNKKKTNIFLNERNLFTKTA